MAMLGEPIADIVAEFDRISQPGMDGQPGDVHGVHGMDDEADDGIPKFTRAELAAAWRCSLATVTTRLMALLTADRLGRGSRVATRIDQRRSKVPVYWIKAESKSAQPEVNVTPTVVGPATKKSKTSRYIPANQRKGVATR